MKRRFLFVVLCLVLCLVLCQGTALAQEAPGLPALTLATDADGSQTWSLSIQVLALMTALTLLPALVLMGTAFTRIIIVLALLRQALGTPQTPPNQVLLGLALFLTFFVMAPVAEQVYGQALQPYLEGTLDAEQAWTTGAGPVREFMLRQTRQADLALFAGMAGEAEFAAPEAVPLRVLAPAFLTSELKTAFQIGFLVFIPFLIIDLVVASVLMAMGMMMLSPMLISLPFKLMLFVLVDGWVLLTGTLASSFLAGA